MSPRLFTFLADHALFQLKPPCIRAWLRKTVKSQGSQHKRILQGIHSVTMRFARPKRELWPFAWMAMALNICRQHMFDDVSLLTGSAL
ncbi:hypothetical protein D3260_06260 [Salinisphaera sp. Q1T1-3]|nr:hypothetical protein D3260_06260 [Salinisphaera sp. Q1T1-3]